MDRTIRQSHKFFEIPLAHDALGWLVLSDYFSLNVSTRFF